MSGTATCPGESCGENAVGAPDSVTVDLRACGILDVVFTGGEIIARIGQPDVALIVDPPVEGGIRIEASDEGDEYTLVGFLRGAPPGTSVRCEAILWESRVLVDIADCNTISNVRFLRLVYEAQGGGGSVRIDALQALSFEPR
jgi:hypothetical protein